MYFLPHLLEAWVGSQAQAVRLAGFYGAGTYALVALVGLLNVRHSVGLRVGALLMALGTALFLWKIPLALWASCMLFAAGSAAWKTHLFPAYKLLGGKSGYLHAAVAGGYLVGVPCFGMISDPDTLVLSIAALFFLLLAGTAFVGICEQAEPDARPSARTLGAAVAFFVALIPLSMLTYIPLLSFAPQAVKLALSIGWNKGFFGTLMLVASTGAGVAFRGSNHRVFVWLALFISLLSCGLLAKYPESVALVILAHILIGVADALLHQFLYAVALRDINGTTTYFVTVAFGQVAISLTASVSPQTMIAALTVLGFIGSAFAYRQRPALTPDSSTNKGG